MLPVCNAIYLEESLCSILWHALVAIKPKRELREFLVIPPAHPSGIFPPPQWHILALVHAENLKRNFLSTILCKINEICNVAGMAGVAWGTSRPQTFCRWRWHHKWPLYCLAAVPCHAMPCHATCEPCHHFSSLEFCGFNIQSHFGLIFLLSFGFGFGFGLLLLAANRLLLSLHFNVWSWQHQNSVENNGKRWNVGA